jgi:type IV pilus assembly protein PilE
VLVVVSILAAVALPAYRRHLLRVNRSEAMTLLLRLQSAEESHYLRHDHYTASIDAAPPAGSACPSRARLATYTLSVSLAADGQSYIATGDSRGRPGRGSRVPRLLHRCSRPARGHRFSRRPALLEVTML